MKKFRPFMCGLFVAATCGCASYTQSKIDLTAQAQQGVTRLRGAIADDVGRRDESANALRERLDAAFDEDVGARPPRELTAGWIIEHRKAYAAAIDAFEARHHAESAALRGMLDTCGAIELALAQLQQMHQAELRLTLPEVKR